jgi:hypothetical protein
MSLQDLSDLGFLRPFSNHTCTRGLKSACEEQAFFAEDEIVWHYGHSHIVKIYFCQIHWKEKEETKRSLSKLK